MSGGPYKGSFMCVALYLLGTLSVVGTISSLSQILASIGGKTGKGTSLQIHKLTVVMMLSLFFVGLLAYPTTLQAQRPLIQWTLVSWPPVNLIQSTLNDFVSTVRKESHGQFLISIDYQTHFEPSQFPDALKFGAFEMSIICSSFHPTKTPVFSVLDLPVLPIESLDAEQAVHDELLAHPAFDQEMRRWETKPLFPLLFPQKELYGKGEPPIHISDWEGMTVAVRDPKLRQVLEQMGSYSVSIPYYDPLKWRSVDATFAFPIDSDDLDRQFRELGFEWRTRGFNAGTAACIVAASDTAYRNLPGQFQEILDRSTQIMEDRIFDARERAQLIVDDGEYLEVIEYSESESLEFIRDSAASGVWNEWAEKVTEQGVPGQDILNFVIQTAEGHPH